MFPVNQILKSPEDGTDSRHPLFGNAGSVVPPGYRRSLQKCSGLLFLHHAGAARRGCQSAERTHDKENTHGQRQKPSDTRYRGLGALCHTAILLRSTESCSRSAAPGGCCTFKGFGMLPNKFLQSKRALYRQRHCLQGFVRTKALLANARPPARAHGLWNKV